MNSIKNLERLKQLHQLIEIEQTGTPCELANRFRVSQRLIYNLIDQLRDFQAEICFDRKRKTYYYAEDFQFTVKISVSVAKNNRVTKIF